MSYTTSAKYAAAHANRAGPGDSRPTALQIIDDEGVAGQWTDKVVLITGVSSGLGIETARALQRTGATLFLTARNLNKAREALGNIVENPRAHLIELDLGSLDSVRHAAAEFLSRSKKLNVLIGNAGVMATPEGRTQDGFETQFGTNHLGHFLLFNLVRDAMLAASTPEFASRVVLVSSVAHRLASVNLDNLTLEGEYDPWIAYAASKTANIYTANEIERRYGSRGLHAWSLHPGGIMTALGRYLSKEQMEAAVSDESSKAMKSPEQGAATQVWAAVGKELEGKGGKYLEDVHIAEPMGTEPATSKGEFESPGYAPHAYDESKAKEVWEKSTELVRL